MKGGEASGPLQATVVNPTLRLEGALLELEDAVRRSRCPRCGAWAERIRRQARRAETQEEKARVFRNVERFKALTSFGNQFVEVASQFEF